MINTLKAFDISDKSNQMANEIFCYPCYKGKRCGKHKNNNFYVK